MDPLDTLKKVEILWYDDADAVFCAGKSKFRLHRGILSAQSTIFKDMFALPQDKETIHKSQKDSFTVITLPDDEYDLYYFFLAIFDSSFYGVPPSTLPMNVTVSILRLAHKYDVPFLLQRTVVQLDRLFSLDYYKLVENSHSKDVDRYDDPDKYSPTLMDTIFKLLRIADSVGIGWIISPVLYAIALRYDIDDYIGGSSFSSLDAKSQCRVVQFNINWQVKAVWYNGWLGLIPSENCLNHDACRYLVLTVQRENLVIPSPSNDTPPPSGQGLCPSCQVAKTEHKKKVRRKFWDEHPIVCGFASWDEVKEARDESMKAIHDGVVKFKYRKYVQRSSVETLEIDG